MTSKAILLLLAVFVCSFVLVEPTRKRSHGHHKHHKERSNSVCTLPKEPGRCMAYFQRYYFNHHTHSCEEFVYGGCQGNANNFETLEQCHSACKPEPELYGDRSGKPVPELYGDGSGKPVPAHYGNRSGKPEPELYGDRSGKRVPELYGDRNGKPVPELYGDRSGKPVPELYGDRSGKPVPELYGDRSGKPVPELYGDRSGKPVPELYGDRSGKPVPELYGDRSGKPVPELYGVCALPKEPGRCMGYFPRYFYNHHTHNCEEFVYGGCQSNGNNFETLEQCLSACRPKPELYGDRSGKPVPELFNASNCLAPGMMMWLFLGLAVKCINMV